jgi:hypothetical protein
VRVGGVSFSSTVIEVGGGSHGVGDGTSRGLGRAGRRDERRRSRSDIDVLSAQVIRYDFVVNGSGSAFTLNYEPDDRSHLTGVGLVE